MLCATRSRPATNSHAAVFVLIVLKLLESKDKEKEHDKCINRNLIGYVAILSISLIASVENNNKNTRITNRQILC